MSNYHSVSNLSIGIFTIFNYTFTLYPILFWCSIILFNICNSGHINFIIISNGVFYNIPKQL